MEKQYFDVIVTDKGEVYRDGLPVRKYVSSNRGNGGYFAVRVNENGNMKTRYIHRLVANLFVPNPENKPQVNHIDGNKKNNAAENLEWVTAKENMEHMYKYIKKHTICDMCGKNNYSSFALCAKCRRAIGDRASIIYTNLRRTERTELYSILFNYAKTVPLNDSQVECLELVSKGMTIAEVCQKTGRSRQAIHNTINSVLAMLGSSFD